MRWWAFTSILLVCAGVMSSVGPSTAQVRTPTNGGGYGYQPYNDRNPTGFNHPNNMGFGHYVYQPKVTGPRAKSLSYRRFRGY